MTFALSCRIAAVLLLAAVALVPAALAVPAPGKHRVGVLVPANTPDLAEFSKGLKELGYEEGRNLVLDVKIAGDRLDQLSAMASEMVKESPEVILSVNTPGTKAAMAATKTIPIVMVAVGDPVATGFVSSLARPDKNVTGLTNLCGELAGKRLALFKRTLTGAKRIAILLNSSDPITAPQLLDIERTAPTLGIEARAFPVRTRAEVDAALPALLQWRADGILWLCGQQRALTRYLLPLASRHHLPVMAYQALELPAGALISYATENADLYRRAALYVDKILKGAAVSDLPVEQPTKFELVINMKVAAELGLTIPRNVLVQADRLIQ
jgi:putative tryptophan/tyrosine transport system substrate-binding protein